MAVHRCTRKIVLFTVSFFLLPACSQVPGVQSTAKHAPTSNLGDAGTDVFCDIITGKKKSVIIYEDDDLIVIEKNPIRDPADCLIIPKKHIVNIKDLNQADPYDATIVSKMVAVAQMLAGRLQAPAEFSVLMNNGATSAQSVFHMHMHFRSPQRWKNPTWRGVQ